MIKTSVKLKERSYDILIGRDMIHRAGRLLKGLSIGDFAVIVTNRRLSRLFGAKLRRSLSSAGISSRFEPVIDSERAKSLGVAARTIRNICSVDPGRKTFLIALGGGVVGDLAGFVAAVYKRGVPYVQIPTTLLAQVDSSIGGKVAVDLREAKNLVGAFYQPRLVISDTSLLRSLPDRQLSSGLAEVIKYGVIADPSLFVYLERNMPRILARKQGSLQYIISRSSAIKAGYVESDEFDRAGVRAKLNYGHTIGHAIEAAGGYLGFGHGESVAIGMAAAAEISFWLGMLKARDLKRIRDVITLAGLPLRAPGVDISKVLSAVRHDKKFSGTVNRFVLPRKIGRAVIVEGVPEPVINAVAGKIFKK